MQILLHLCIMVLVCLSVRLQISEAAEGGDCRETGVAEHLTTQQKQEVDEFLDAIVGTQPMLFVHQQLAAMVSTPAPSLSA